MYLSFLYLKKINRSPIETMIFRNEFSLLREDVLTIREKPHRYLKNTA